MMRTILLVEDEEMLREFVSDVLRMSGYVVVEAENVRSALAIWEKQKGLIDLLLTDIDLRSEITGIDLAQKFQLDRPSLGVLFSTGHDTHRLRMEFGLEPDAVVLEKPYRVEDLIRMVNESVESADRESVEISFLEQRSHDHFDAVLA